MNQDEFEQRIHDIHERVLSKSLSQEEKNNYTESLFESIKHLDRRGQEFWYARELSKILEYKDFRNFELTIFKAMEACENSGNTVSDHFGEGTEMVAIGSGAKREFSSCILSRYACYLYHGLYGGLGVKESHARKELKKSQKIPDHMGSTELAANLFRATQTDEKLRREHIVGKEAALPVFHKCRSLSIRKERS